MNITWTYPMAKEMNRGSWNPKMLEGSSSRVRLMQCGGVIMKVSVNVMCFLKI